MRNLVLFASTLLVFAVLFAGYVLLVRDPGTADTRRGQPTILPAADSGDGEVLEIGPARISAGERFAFTSYNDRTGQPRARVVGDDWRPVRDEKNTFEVARPELTMLLPSGMVATISAETGTIVVDRQRTRMKPRSGKLRGAATIVIDRARDLDRTPIADRPADAITIATEQLEFDLELGTLETDQAISVRSAQFDIAGTGLSLEWNEIENRVEHLILRQGEHMVLYGMRGLMGSMSDAEDAPAAEAAATPPLSPDQPAAARRGTTYECVLTGGVEATHWSGDAVAGGLAADELRVLFDLGGSSRGLGAPSPTSAPASAPTTGPRERLEIVWHGPLKLTPTEDDAGAGAARRRLEALGDVVQLTSPRGSARCGRLVVHDETGQIWLYRMADGRVEFSRGDELAASADSVYIDQDADVVKLIGDVDFQSRRGSDEAMRIRCTLWAELHIGREGDAGPQTALDPGGLESAAFVGAVTVGLREQTLSAHRLDIGFRAPTGDDGPVEALLDTAVAGGDVHMATRERTIDCGQLALAFGLTEQGRVYPSRMEAGGAAVIRQDRARIAGALIEADFAPLEGPDGQDAEIVLRSLRVSRGAELYAPKDRVAAYGERIVAAFTGRNHPLRATVEGTTARPGRLQAGSYAVHGGRIELDEIDVENDTLALRVVGPSRVRFRSNRGLQGQRRRKPMFVDVVSNESLLIDGKRNTVYFAGQVVARSGDDKLRCDRLTLLLDETADTAEATPATSTGQGIGLSALFRQMYSPIAAWRPVFGVARVWTATLRGERSADQLLAGDRRRDERARRELTRLSALNAVVESESYDASEARPVVHSSLAATLLEVNFPERLIRTEGQTTLLMTNRHMAEDFETASGALGLPSAMITRGPSQTAMKCERGMTYALGPDGPHREDKALFEGAVLFVHAAGREMVDIEAMLPELRADPELIAKLKSRRTKLECDRLECVFVSPDGPQRESAIGGALQLSELIASDTVYLRDKQGPAIREVFADWVEFNRPQAIVHVTGTDEAPARVYYQNIEQGIFADPVVSPDILINLRDNTVRSTKLRGGVARP